MSAEDWIPDFDFDDYDDGSVLCRYCNAECVWVETDRGWRLFDITDNAHVCAERLKRDASEELITLER